LTRKICCSLSAMFIGGCLDHFILPTFAYFLLVANN
jgi:hypothetical protein